MKKLNQLAILGIAAMFALTANALTPTKNVHSHTVQTKTAITHSKTAAHKAAIHKKIDVNKATASMLTKFRFISKKDAKNIVHYRKEHGNFKSIADVAKLTGLKGKKLEIYTKKLERHFSV